MKDKLRILINSIERLAIESNLRKRFEFIFGTIPDKANPNKNYLDVLRYSIVQLRFNGWLSKTYFKNDWREDELFELQKRRLKASLHPQLNVIEEKNAKANVYNEIKRIDTKIKRLGSQHEGRFRDIYPYLLTERNFFAFLESMESEIAANQEQEIKRVNKMENRFNATERKKVGDGSSADPLKKVTTKHWVFYYWYIKQAGKELNFEYHGSETMKDAFKRIAKSIVVDWKDEKKTGVHPKTFEKIWRDTVPSIATSESRLREENIKFIEFAATQLKNYKDPAPFKIAAGDLKEMQKGYKK